MGLDLENGSFPVEIKFRIVQITPKNHRIKYLLNLYGVVFLSNFTVHLILEFSLLR